MQFPIKEKENFIFLIVVDILHTKKCKGGDTNYCKKMSARISYDEAISQLVEMFPNHSRETIDRVLRQNKGKMEPSITVLLTLKSERKSHHSSSSRSKPAPARPAPQDPQPIFPRDYLRWPKDVNYIKVSSSESNSLIEPNEVDPYWQRTSGAGATLDGGSGTLKSLSVEDFTASSTHGASAWESFKKKFAPDADYDQL